MNFRKGTLYLIVFILLVVLLTSLPFGANARKEKMNRVTVDPANSGLTSQQQELGQNGSNVLPHRNPCTPVFRSGAAPDPSMTNQNYSNEAIRRRITLHVGGPAIWSLGQAHYLLAKMHQADRGLETPLPNSNALDPNAINMTKLQIIKQLLSVEAQFDQNIGIGNRAELNEFKRKLLQRDRADAALQDKNDELGTLDTELRKLKREQAKLAKELEFLKAEREAKVTKDPDDPSKTIVPLPDEKEKQLIKQKAELDVLITSKETERGDLVKEIADLKTTANGTPTKPTLNNVPIDNTRGTLPGFSYLNDYLKKSLDQVDRPRLAATMILDNFIGMQNEIIAKQLTLLRDEVGPENRIVFLELPASIYTADSKGNDYIAQVQWQITQFKTHKSPAPKKKSDAAVCTVVKKICNQKKQS